MRLLGNVLLQELMLLRLDPTPPAKCLRATTIGSFSHCNRFPITTTNEDHRNSNSQQLLVLRPILLLLIVILLAPCIEKKAFYNYL